MKNSSGSSGRVVLVTGATSGIGRSICRVLSERGDRVVVNYRSDVDGAHGLENDIGEHCFAYYADVSSETEVDKMFSEILGRYGRLDYLVNNASFAEPRLWNLDPLAVPADALRRSFEVDFLGTFFCVRSAVPLMMQNRDGGAIINFSSGGSLSGDPDTFAYNAAKTAVVSLTKTIAKVYAPKVRAFTIAPGSIDTGWVERWNLTQDEIENLKASKAGMKRVGTANEIAALVQFLLSSQADYLLGSTFTADGGTSL